MKTFLKVRSIRMRFVEGLLLLCLLPCLASLTKAAGTGAATAGGGRSTGGVYANQSTLGQVAGPTITGGAYHLTSGFQSGNARVDESPPGTGAPIITFIADQVIDEDTETDPIPVTISDPDTPLPQLTVNRTSSNLMLVRPVDIVFGGAGSNRVMRITPRPNQSGSAIITITATDPQDHFTSRSFLVEVLPVNDPPVLLTVAQANTIEDTPTAVLSLLVRDLETPADELVVSARSDNPALVPGDAFSFGGSDSNRWVRIQPAPDQFGQALITLNVSDGETMTETSFPLAVTPRNDPPTILPLTDITIESGQARIIDVTMNDVDDDPTLLNVVPLSDNPTLIPIGGLALMGQGSRRQLSITPAPDQTGEAHVGLQVTDPHGATASTSFRVTVTPAQKLFAGLRFSTLAGARADVNSNSVLQVSNLSTQTESGVSFELGQAQGFLALQEATQMESRKFLTLTRVTGRQGGLTRPLVSVASKWEGPSLDASKNEVSIETLELAHEGLTVQHYDGNGRQLGDPFISPGSAVAIECLPNSSVAAEVRNRSGSIIILDNDGETEVARHHLRVVVFPFGIMSPRDAASGLPTGRVVMKDGSDNITLENYAYSIFNYENLSQTIEALERVELLGVGETQSFVMTDAALIQDGLKIRGDGNTLLRGFRDAGQAGFYALPEVDDEVLVTFSAIDTWDNGSELVSAREIDLPALDWSSPGTKLELEDTQRVRNPAAPGVIESVGTKYTMLKTAAGYSLQTVFKGEIVVLEPFYQLQIFNQGVAVASFTVDQDLNMPDLAISGPGQPLRVRPGLPRSDANVIETGITFDGPMTISVGDEAFAGDEVVIASIAFKEAWAEIVSHFASLRLRSPGQTEYRFTPEAPEDWGDLPAPYMTAATQNGARHRIVRGLRLGRRIDPESNGRPNPSATGDDNFLDDDEDGVIFASALAPGVKGSIVNINVVAPPTGAFIDGFVDWDANGNIEDAGEKFLDRRPVVNGQNTFSFDVPPGARPGRTYARFRLSLEGGLDCEGPASSGEVEDCVVRILPAAPPAHPSGLAVVPHGGANLWFGAGGALEITGITDGGDDGVNLLAPSNVVSRAAGRISLPLDPPIPLSAFASMTRPHADGLRLAAHYTGAGGSFWQPSLRFLTGAVVSNAMGGVSARVGFEIWCEDTKLVRNVRTCVFDAGGYKGSFFWNSNLPNGGTGYISGNSNAHIVRLGWATFPSSVIVVFDRDVTFTGPDGTQLIGQVCRSLVLDESGQPYSPPDLTFTGLSMWVGNIGGGILGFSDLRVRNPMPPSLTGVNLLANGSAMTSFPAEPDVFYSLEATDSLASPSWGPPTTAYQFGTGSTGTLSDPRPAAASRFYRLRLE